MCEKSSLFIQFPVQSERTMNRFGVHGKKKVRHCALSLRGKLFCQRPKLLKKCHTFFLLCLVCRSFHVEAVNKKKGLKIDQKYFLPF